jgi:hypothetical protein
MDVRIASYAELAVYPTAIFVPGGPRPPRDDIATKTKKHAPAAAGQDDGLR